MKCSSRWDAIPFFFFLLGLLLSLFIAPLWNTSTTPVHALAQKSSNPTPDFAAIDRYLQEEVEATRIPGLALAIVHEDQIVHLKGFGVADPSGRPVTPQTPFNIGSLSKTLTALAVLQLEEDGKIELDAPVQKYLPWFQVADPDASAQITVLHLLNHTSGIPITAGNDYPAKDDTSDSALENRVRALSTIRLDRTVGAGFEYSNANYDTLGMIVQVVSGLPYEKYIEQNIFAPLEMKRSFLSRTDAHLYDPATGYRMWFGFPFPYAGEIPRPHLPSGQHFSSAEDMAHLFIAYLNGGMYQDVSMLSETGIWKMQNSPVSSGPDCATYSMHWSHSSRCDSSSLWLGGDTANFKARVQVLPEEKWAVVILMNTQALWINGPRQDRIDDGVIDLLRGKTPVSSNPHNMAIFGGVFFLTAVTLTLVAKMVRSITRFRRQNTGEPPKMGRGVILPLAIDILWVLILITMLRVTGGQSSDHPLSFMLENAPDTAWVILLSAVIALGWGVIRTILIYMRLERN